MDLKYLFRAEFTDGSSFTQQKDDTASIAPQGSSFSDLLHLITSGKKLSQFVMVGQAMGCVAVNMEDGHFEIGGAPLTIGEELPPVGADLKLIYYRQHRINFNPQMQETGRTVRYCIGWETHLADGRKLKNVMGVF